MGALMAVLAAAAGLLAGLAYFSILHTALQRLAATRHPWVLMLGAYALRVALALGVFALFLHGPGERLALALAAFLVARALVLRRAGAA